MTTYTTYQGQNKWNEFNTDLRFCGYLNVNTIFNSVLMHCLMLFDISTNIRCGLCYVVLYCNDCAVACNINVDI